MPPLAYFAWWIRDGWRLKQNSASFHGVNVESGWDSRCFRGRQESGTELIDSDDDCSGHSFCRVGLSKSTSECGVHSCSIVLVLYVLLE